MKNEKIESLCEMSFRMPLSKGLDAVAGLLLNLVDRALEKYNLRSYDRLLLPCPKRRFDRVSSLLPVVQKIDCCYLVRKCQAKQEIYSMHVPPVTQQNGQERLIAVTRLDRNQALTEDPRKHQLYQLSLPSKPISQRIYAYVSSTN